MSKARELANVVPGIDSAANATAITIDSNENVGIGTSSPAEKLHLANSTTAATYAKFTNNATTQGLEVGVSSIGQGIINFQDNDDLRIFTNDTERMRIDSSGNVGIGTTNISSKLNVQGGVTFTGNWKFTAKIVENETNRKGFYLGYDDTAQRSVIIAGSAGTPSEIAFVTYGPGWNERMRIDSSGRVTMPYQPAFAVSGCTGTTSPGVADKWSVVEVNVGGYFNANTGTFTAPVAGRYIFNGNFMGDGSSAYTFFRWKKNDLGVGAYHHTSSVVTSYRWTSGSIVVDLAAGDTIKAYIYQTGLYGATSDGTGTSWSGMSGYLIG